MPQHTLSVFTILLAFSHLHSFFSHLQLSHGLAYLILDSFIHSIALPLLFPHTLLLLLFIISNNNSVSWPGLFVTLPSSGLLWQQGHGKASALGVRVLRSGYVIRYRDCLRTCIINSSILCTCLLLSKCPLPRALTPTKQLNWMFICIYYIVH